MPGSFDKFRLLNDGGIRNESSKMLFVRAREEDVSLEVPPGAEEMLPVTTEGETIIEVVNEG